MRKAESMAEKKVKETEFTADELLVRLCEEIAYERKAENIICIYLHSY